MKYDYDYDYTASGENHVEGRLTRVRGNWDSDDTAEFTEEYRYSRESQIIGHATDIEGLGEKAIIYHYDSGGRLRKAVFDSSSAANRFFLWYEYDSAGRLNKIFLHTTNSQPTYPTAEYFYNARGQVTKVLLRDGSSSTVRQRIDYTFNNRGFLEAINDPGLVLVRSGNTGQLLRHRG